MLKFAILAVLALPSIRAALTHGEMTSALIAAENTGTLEDTFKKYEKEQSHNDLSVALVDVAKVPAHMPKVATCLRVAHDPFPEDMSRVSYLVSNTLFRISFMTDIESLTNVITSFKPSDVKPLASIRYWTLRKDDAVDVLKRIMDKHPELITDNLPSWLAFHSLDRDSDYYKPVLEEAFQYLTSFATQGILEEALSILGRNEHYKTVYKSGHTAVGCCSSLNHSPHVLFNKIKDLLKFVKARNTRIKEALTLLPKVLVDLMLEYVTVSDSSISTPETSVSVLDKRFLPLQPRTSHKKSK